MKKLMSWLLALCLVVGMVPMTALAADGSTAAWDGTVDTTWYNGNDTIFTIEDAAELAGLAQLVNQGNTFSGKTVKLGADIDLGDKEWTPIGTSSNPFKGTFDGAKEDGTGNYSISNLYINRKINENQASNNSIGLFGATNSPAVVKNLTLNNVDIQGCLYVGAVVGYGFTGTVSNVAVQGNIEIDAWWYAGGIIGNGYVSISNCHVDATNGSYIKGNEGSYIGGIIGYRGEGIATLTGCTVKNISISGEDRLGGISGIAHYGSYITDCHVEGVTISSDNTECKTIGLIAGANLAGSSGQVRILDCTAENTTATVAGTSITNQVSMFNHTGGTVTSAVVVGSKVTFDANGKVTGGLFEQLTEDMVADGLEKQENEDGTIEVLPSSGEAVAVIGYTYYTTLQEAIDVAQNGDIIQVLSDITLSSPISVKKTLTFEGVTKSDGTKPVIRSSQGSGIFSQSGDAVYTLKNLELQISNDGQWYIYHSANTLTIDHCDFVMPDGVEYTGNVVMGEGEPKDDGDYALIFTNNTIKANSRAAITGIGNGSVVTGNEIDLIDEAYGEDEESRTSVISITAIDGKAGVTITDNTFKNSNRAIAVDNSTLKAENLTIQNNKFIDVRYAFELSPTENKTCGTYDLNKNYFEFDGVVSAPKIENADSTGDHFETGEGSTEYLPADGEADLVENDEYYIKDTMRPEDLNTYVPTITVYDNTVATTTNGTATVTDVKKGATATITTTPDKGYKVGSVTVLDNSGKAVTVTNIGDGKYTFTQPTGGVTVTVTFVWDNPFTDVGEAWYTEAIQYVYQNGLMAGTGATTFEPNTQLTRAMAVQILYNVEGKPTVTGEATFTDAAAAGDWAVDAITWAEQNGVVAGMGDGTFAPNAKVTREQFAQMMYNYAEYKDYDLTKTGNLAQFSDEGDVSSWAETALKWANGNGLINGHDDGTLEPQGTAIRAQAASILMNFDLTFVK